MSKTWKWILGILAALVIVGAVAGAVFVWRNHALASVSLRATRPQLNIPGAPSAPTVPNGQQGPIKPYGFGNDRRYPMGGWGWRGPMMRDRGFSHFGRFMPFGIGFFFLGGLLRLIIPLGVLALVAYVFYQMGRRAGTATASSVAPPATPSAPLPGESPKPGRRVAKN